MSHLSPQKVILTYISISILFLGEKRMRWREMNKRNQNRSILILNADPKQCLGHQWILRHSYITPMPSQKKRKLAKANKGLRHKVKIERILWGSESDLKHSMWRQVLGKEKKHGVVFWMIFFFLVTEVIHVQCWKPEKYKKELKKKMILVIPPPRYNQWW